jgi:tetratricopeptide (TPR) repeat protein
MAQISLKSAERTTQALLLESRFEEVGRVLELAARDLEDWRSWKLIAQLYERIPRDVLEASDRLSCGHATSLVGARLQDRLLLFTQNVLIRRSGPIAARLQTDRAWALIAEGRFDEAHGSLEVAIPHLTGEHLGIALRRLGLASFHLGRAWRGPFEAAKTLLHGRALGFVLLDQGFCLDRSAQAQAARLVWAEAIQYFPRDAFHRAWLQYNIGITALRDGEPEAERHLRYAEELTHSQAAAEFRATVLIGLAAARRARGEWARAEATARAALRIAREPLDRQQAHLGLGRTLRLSGRALEALEHYELARDAMPNSHEAHVSLAACYLALADTDRARDSLGRAGIVTGFSVWLRAIVGAELARRSGELDRMIECLAGLPLTMLYVREEVNLWPELFAAILVQGQAVPQALPRLTLGSVRVAALGVLHVTVNDQPIPLSPTGRAAELLVFLLENDGQATLERLTDAFFPLASSAGDLERARKALWNAVQRLRESLGWSQSVQALRGAYRLDPTVLWEYDVNEVRRGGTRASGLFMDGLYSNWVEEVRVSL